MRSLLIALIALFVVGCANAPDEPPVAPVAPVVVLEVPPVAPIAPEAQPPDVDINAPAPPDEQEKEGKFTKSYIRGYNDGYSGRWIAPAAFIIANEYRAGWDSGRRDMKTGKPNKFGL